ncbi:MAG: FapA family protein [Clostridia bacterium]|nr:FapA family protein [Clostridia bacterium]
MADNIIFINEYLKFISMDDGVYIETFKKGFPFDQLNHILSVHPQIEITSFTILKSAITNAPMPPKKIGSLKDRLIIETLEHNLKATVLYNLTKDELDPKNRNKLMKETLEKLKEKGIVFGIKKDFFSGEIAHGIHYIIAEGIPPQNGKDSIIKMYQLEEPKPEVNQNGKVNFYELKLINRVKDGDWLGEKTEPTQGIAGKSVKGEVLKATDGKSIPLVYDKNTVMEQTQGNKTILYSRINGAVSYVSGKITVSNHLEIEGDVDFKTGNIKFDGYLTIRGTVADGFQVIATNDIEINGELGLGNVKGIVSTNGSIYIKGGVASKGKVEIKAAKNIYTKFVDNSTINCGESIHIGSYCINSNIQAKEVIIDSPSGLIVGGNVKAQIRVVTPTLGSEMEKRTVVEIIGFDREALNKELSHIIQSMSELKNEQQKAKTILSRLEELEQLSPAQQKEYNNSFQKISSIKDSARELELKRRIISDYLKTRGEGEICINKKIFPNCLLIINKRRIEITSVTLATSIYSIDGEIKYS